MNHANNQAVISLGVDIPSGPTIPGHVHILSWNQDKVFHMRPTCLGNVPSTPACVLAHYAGMPEGMDYGESILTGEGKKPSTVRAAHTLPQAATQDMLTWCQSTRVAPQVYFKVSENWDFLIAS
jgi:hypothetical protein